MSALFGAGLILLAVAAAAGFISAGPRWMRALPYTLGAVGSACLASAGGFALTGRTVELNVAGWFGRPIGPGQSAGLAVDRLSGMFLVMALGAAVPVSVALASWATRADAATRLLAEGYALAVGATVVIMTARDAFTVLFGWEALTAAFYLLAGANRKDRDRAGAARVTVAFGKVSGAALLVGLLLLVAKSHSILLASFGHAPGGAATTTGFVLLIAGFAVKAGLVPFQVWMPRGYAAAPGPARAVMAGVCVNVAFYGMWRTLALDARPPGWLAGVLLVLGGISALLGIAHAAVQNRLSRVIAYSSVENSGLIITGFGVALTGAATGDRRLIAVGLLAATLQMVAHTAAKSLLFSSAAGLEVVAGSDDMEMLRGMARRAPWSSVGLTVGSLTLAGLPPTAGFVSEWFLLESLMQQFRVTSLGGRLTLALAGAAVALTAGFAGVTFVRLVGMVVLGPAGSERRRGREYGWAGRIALAALAVCPLAIAAVTPLEIRVISAGLSPAVPAGLTMGALKSPWVLRPVFAGFSILSPSWLWVEIPVMLA
ncbi:MAG: proton-conducting transporter membrane subunit, partial [Streptosporangiaceae bacterium]